MNLIILSLVPLLAPCTVSVDTGTATGAGALTGGGLTAILVGGGLKPEGFTADCLAGTATGAGAGILIGGGIGPVGTPVGSPSCGPYKPLIF